MDDDLDPLSPNALSARDLAAPESITALALIRVADRKSRTTPGLFRCSNGEQYWVKPQQESGYSAAELFAGRLGVSTGIAPVANVVDVCPEALPPDDSLARFLGTWVGIRNVEGSVNAQDLAQHLTWGTFDRDRVDHDSWAEAITFQTWLGVSDEQVLVSLTTGRVISFDHEEWQRNLDGHIRRVVVAPILDLQIHPRFVAQSVERAVVRIEHLADDVLASAVAIRQPSPWWVPPLGDRLQIARYLAYRRERLRPVMEKWVGR